MHFTNDVDIPDSLIEAQENGNLVIFAGAGVSTQAPSNLPNFIKLAKDVEGKFNISWDDDNEPIDQYLGKVCQSNQSAAISVREFIFRIFSSLESKPAKIHRDLISLFPTNYPVRIVTTNYDRHLTSVLSSSNLQIKHHYAPNLPPGNRFEFRNCKYRYNGLPYEHSPNFNINNMGWHSLDKDHWKMNIIDSSSLEIWDEYPGM